MAARNDGIHLRTTQSWANRTRPKVAVQLKSRGGERDKWHQIHYQPPTTFDAVRKLAPEPDQTTMKQSKGQDIVETVSVSSYWSASEATNFPSYLSAFGSDWYKLSAHMGTKSPVMVKNYYLKRTENDETDWEERVRAADNKRDWGERLPIPPPPSPPVMKGSYKLGLAAISPNEVLVSETDMEEATSLNIVSPGDLQPTTGRFDVPTIAEPQQQGIPSAMPSQPMPGASSYPRPLPERSQDIAIVMPDTYHSGMPQGGHNSHAINLGTTHASRQPSVQQMKRTSSNTRPIGAPADFQQININQGQQLQQTLAQKQGVYDSTSTTISNEGHRILESLATRKQGRHIGAVTAVSVARTISRDNTAGNDHKKSQCMAILGLKHNKGHHPWVRKDFRDNNSGDFGNQQQPAIAEFHYGIPTGNNGMPIFPPGFTFPMPPNQ